MELIGIALMVFSVVLLICVIYYVSTQMRYKEKMALLDKGLNPADYRSNIREEALRIGMALMGAGFGFCTGILLEWSGIFPHQIELPLYIAPVLLFTGAALVLFYKKQQRLPG
ncbi:MAG: hypothetical protein KDC57_00690 [Saprospiraceae bacterium]|nr:hypothetical protein [Saprospiraceae bacterium]